MIYVDNVTDYPQGMIARPVKRHGCRWCHLFGTDLEELHLFAKGIGLRKEWFQDKPGFPHYDITPVKRNMALLRGAVAKSLINYLRERRVSAYD